MSRTFPAILHPTGVRTWSALSTKELQKRLRTHGVISNNVSFIHTRQIGSNVPDCGNESRNGQSWKPRMRQHMHRSPSAAKSLSVNLNISICTFWRAVHICCMFLAFVSLSNKDMGLVACKDYFIGGVKKNTVKDKRICRQASNMRQ
jgi:hypothetical protein